MKVALVNRGPSVIPMEERFQQFVPKAERCESRLKPLSKHAPEFSSTRTSSSRTRWTSTLAQIEADHGRIILLRMILELRYVVGDGNKNIEQDEI